MNNAQQARADARAEIARKGAAGVNLLQPADWKGRSTHVWIACHGQAVFVRGPATTPGSQSNRIKRRDINRARQAGKKLAALNRRIEAGRV